MSLLILFAICWYATMFLSAAEMAFVSSSHLGMRHRADTGEVGARKILRLQENPQYFLTALLVANNIVNIGATALFTSLVQIHFGWHNEWAVTAVMAPLLIILGELVPKDYGRIRSEGFLLRHADSLELFVRILHWPVALLLGAVNVLLGRFKSMLHKNFFASEKEFRLLIEESARSGVLEDHERQLINTILDFEKIHLMSVMIPLHQVPKLSIAATVGELKGLARRLPTKVVLVYEEIPSIVIALVYVHDILFETDDTKHLKEYLRSPIFLPGSTSIEKAFLALQQKRQSYAVVMDEKSEAIGVVPIEGLIDF